MGVEFSRDEKNITAFEYERPGQAGSCLMTCRKKNVPFAPSVFNDGFGVFRFSLAGVQEKTALDIFEVRTGSYREKMPTSYWALFLIANFHESFNLIDRLTRIVRLALYARLKARYQSLPSRILLKKQFNSLLYKLSTWIFWYVKPDNPPIFQFQDDQKVETLLQECINGHKIHSTQAIPVGNAGT